MPFGARRASRGRTLEEELVARVALAGGVTPVSRLQLVRFRSTLGCQTPARQDAPHQRGPLSPKSSRDVTRSRPAHARTTRAANAPRSSYSPSSPQPPRPRATNAPPRHLTPHKLPGRIESRASGLRLRNTRVKSPPSCGKTILPITSTSFMTQTTGAPMIGLLVPNRRGK